MERSMSLHQKPKAHKEALADREDGREATAGRLGLQGKGREEAHRKPITGAEEHLMALLAAAILELFGVLFPRQDRFTETLS